MNDSILTTVKKGIGGLTETDESFDPDIIMFINTVLATLTQIGVGSDEGFRITDKSATWTDFVGDDPKLNMVQTYVTLSVRMMFDPPTVGAVAEAFKTRIAELEWRLNVAADSNKEIEEEIQNG